MIETAAGVTIPEADRLLEQYEIDGDRLNMNLSFEKLPQFVTDFYEMLDEPLFLALHPDADSDEVWYLDGCRKKQLHMILEGYGELLFQDGLSSFAIASHETSEEIFIQKYKIISIYSPKLARFFPLLEKNGVTRTDHLLTAWDTFTEDAPGSATRLQIAGMQIPDLVRELKKIGMYRA